MGFGIDSNFELQTTQLVPLEIPIGTAAVAQATRNVFIEGTLTPTGDIADTAEVIESTILGDASIPRPDVTGSTINIAATPDPSGSALAGSAGGGLNAGSTYEYRFSFVDAIGTESSASTALTHVLGAGDGTITVNNVPGLSGTPPEYSLINIYRRQVGVEPSFHLIGQTNQGAASFVDNGIASGTVLDESSIAGNLSYLVTYYKNGEEESRPSLVLGPQNVSNGRIHLRNLPTPPTPGPGDTFPAYDQIRVYRNLSTDSSNFYLVSTLSPGDEFTDSRTDTEISDLSSPLNKLVDLDGPKVDPNTLLTNVLVRDNFNFSNVYQEGTLDFAGKKGGRTLSSKEFDITATSTVQDLIEFMEESLGVQVAADDLQNPIVGSVNNIPGQSGTLAPGGSVQSGRIRFVSNNGVDNALDVGLSAYTLTDSSGTVTKPGLGFGSIQTAGGQSAVSDFIVFDSLGIPLNVRVTSILESRTSTETTYRWFADSPDNDPTTGSDISVGTGLIKFDGEGNLVSVSNATLSIDRRNVPSQSPLDIDMDFTNVTGLSQDSPVLNAASQDGAATGKLANYTVGEDGIIKGSFTNGTTRTLGQIRLVRFSNTTGLEQRGLNQYAEGSNSGLPIEGDPGQDGLASITAGALELSNTDVGQSLVDLVLATTQYRGNSRVITATQQLFDELLNLRR